MPENKGNLITRRAFAERDGVKLRRIEILAEVTHKKGATAYQMTEEVGLFGSGRKSPLHIQCELIKRLVEEGDLTAAREMAAYPRIYLNELEAGGPRGDAIAILCHLLKSVSDASYIVKGRAIEDLPLGELKEFSEKIISAMAAASALGLVTEALIETKERGHKGTPVQAERISSSVRAPSSDAG